MVIVLAGDFNPLINQFLSNNMPHTLSSKVLSFYQQLKPDVLPEGIEVMLPFADAETWRVTEAFYTKYYNDNHTRVFILGINPGRFGGGVTGIPFTDPIRLEADCGIPNSFAKKQEISSVFVYEMIRAFGGTEAFYSKFYINSLYPMALTHKGKNINYYDTPALLAATRKPIIENVQTQIGFGLRTDIAICWGEGKNYNYLQKLNAEFGFFKEVIPLPHPRFIVQYKRKQLAKYIERYLEVFDRVLQK